MDELLNNLKSVSWWISVVFVGILINLVASYLRPILDRMSASVSRQVREVQKRERQKWESTVSTLLDSPHRQLLHAAKTNTLLLHSVRLLVLAVSFWGLAGFFLYCYVMSAGRSSGIITICVCVTAFFFQGASRDSYMHAKRARLQLEEAITKQHSE
jgi:hypothetical protein